MKRYRVISRLVLIAVSATLSSGCAIKYSNSTFEDDWFDSRNGGWSPPLGIAITPENIPLGISGLGLSLERSGQSLDVDAVPPLVDFESVSLISVAIAGRFYPIDRGPFRPYAGAGYGRTQLKGSWRGPNYDVARYTCLGDCRDTYTEIFFSGYHPHLVGGVELRPPSREHLSLLFEYRKDIDRGDDFYRLDGSSISVGLRIRIEG